MAGPKSGRCLILTDLLWPQVSKLLKGPSGVIHCMPCPLELDQLVRRQLHDHAATTTLVVFMSYSDEGSDDDDVVVVSVKHSMDFECGASLFGIDICLR